MLSLKHNMDKIVAYYRVSTDKQGIKGLGIEGQKEAVIRTFGVPIAEYVEVESGKKNNRPELHKAMDACKEFGATLVIAKLDRLSRNVAFIANLMESGVRFKAADLPDVDNLTVHILAAVAQKERELISQRVVSALAVKKKQLEEVGKRLGCPDVTRSGRTVKDVMIANRANRVYSKPDPKKVETLKILKQSGQPMSKLQEVASQLFGRQLSNVTIYNYLKNN